MKQEFTSKEAQRKYEQEIEKRKGKTANAFLDYVNDYDLFKLPVKGFNLKGKSEIGSLTGLLLTFFVYLVVSLYAVQKFHTLMYKKFPMVYQVTEQDKYNETEVRSFT